MGWVTGAQDLFTADFTAVITTVATDDDGINWYNWAMLAPVSDGSGSYGNGLYDLLDDGPSGTYSSDVDDNTAMRELNNALLAIPEGGTVVRARVCGESDGGILFTFSAPPTPVICGGVALDGDTGLTSTYADIIGVDLPAAGTYVLNAKAYGGLQTSVASTQLVQYQLYDATNSVVVPVYGSSPVADDITFVSNAPTTGFVYQAQAASTQIYAVTGPTTIYLQARYVGSDVSTAALLSTTAEGTTSLTWIKIA